MFEGLFESLSGNQYLGIIIPILGIILCVVLLLFIMTIMWDAMR